MRKRVIIIVEKTSDTWTAQFESDQEISFQGPTPEDAIKLLLAHFGTHHFETDRLILISDATADSRTYLVPLRQNAPPPRFTEN